MRSLVASALLAATIGFGGVSAATAAPLGASKPAAEQSIKHDVRRDGWRGHNRGWRHRGWRHRHGYYGRRHYGRRYYGWDDGCRYIGPVKVCDRRGWY